MIVGRILTGQSVDPSTLVLRIDARPKWISFIAIDVPPKEFVGCWPLVNNIATHSGVRPCTGSRLSLDVTGDG